MDKTQMISRTGTIFALLMLVQWLTGYTVPFAGTYIADTCINLILVVTVLRSGLWVGAAVAILAPFCAFFLRIGVEVFQAVPAVAMGDFALVVLSWLLMGRKECSIREKLLGVAVSSLVKFIVLYCAVVKVLIPVMGPALSAQKATALTNAFSWNQLVTALLGSALAAVLITVLGKAKKK